MILLAVFESIALMVAFIAWCAIVWRVIAGEWPEF